MKTNRKILLKDLGLKDYKDIWEYQTSLLNSIIDIKKQNRKNRTKNPTKNYFLFVELNKKKIIFCRIFGSVFSVLFFYIDDTV